ncbi:MAG: RNA polymerase sigma factor [Hyphomicrobiaceae bacterium]
MFRQKNSHDVVRQGLKALYPRLWRYCLALTANPQRADDLTQAVCLRALERFAQFKQDTHLDRWVFRIAKNVWLNELRAESVRRGGGLASIDEIELTDTLPDPEMNLLAREVLLEVMRLPEAQRETVMLVYVEGYSYKEAAEVLEIPVGTVMSRLAVARTRLGTKFERRKSETG